MNPNRRPLTAEKVAEVTSLEEFGRNLRDWQHSLRAVTSRPEALRRFSDSPSLLQEKFEGGDVADAYLASYVAWASDQCGLSAPPWVHEPQRVAKKPWFSTRSEEVVAATPEQFKRRNIFTIPEPLITVRAGRPKTSSITQKKALARERQQRYRQRCREELLRLRDLERSLTP